MEDESSYTVRTENGLIHLMSEEDVGKLVRNSIQRAKTSSAKATSFTRTRNRRSVDLALLSGRSHISGIAQYRSSSRRAIDAPTTNGTLESSTDAPEDRKQDPTDLFREASRRVASRSRLTARKEARVDTSSREGTVTNERDSIADPVDVPNNTNRSPPETSSNNFHTEGNEATPEESVETNVDLKSVKPSSNKFSAVAWQPNTVDTDANSGERNKSFTVNTEAEGRKNLSETEINNLVRSSIQRARQLAKTKGKRRTSPPGIGAGIRKIKEKRDAPESSISKKTATLRPLGTIHRKFTWSSIEESSSDGGSSSKLVKKTKKTDKERKSEKKKKEDHSKKSDRSTTGSDKYLRVENAPHETSQPSVCIENEEIAPPFNQADLDDETSLPGRNGNAADQVCPSINAQDHGNVQAEKVALTSIEISENDKDDVQSIQTSSVPSQRISDARDVDDEQLNDQGISLLQTDDVDAKLAVEHGVNPTFSDTNHLPATLTQPSFSTDKLTNATQTNNSNECAPLEGTCADASSIPPNADILQGEDSRSAMSSSANHICADRIESHPNSESTKLDFDAVSELSLQIKDSNQADLNLVPESTSIVKQDFDANSVSDLLLRDSEKFDLSQGIVPSKLADTTANELVHSLLNDLLFQKRAKSPPPVGAREASPKIGNEEPVTTEASPTSTTEVPLILSSITHDQRMQRSDPVTQIVEGPSQKLRSSLLGASNSELKETITFEGEISLPTVSDNQSISDELDEEEKVCQIPCSVVFDSTMTNSDMNGNKATEMQETEREMKQPSRLELFSSFASLPKHANLKHSCKESEYQIDPTIMHNEDTEYYDTNAAGVETDKVISAPEESVQQISQPSRILSPGSTSEIATAISVPTSPAISDQASCINPTANNLLESSIGIIRDGEEISVSEECKYLPRDDEQLDVGERQMQKHAEATDQHFSANTSTRESRQSSFDPVQTQYEHSSNVEDSRDPRETEVQAGTGLSLNPSTAPDFQKTMSVRHRKNQSPISFRDEPLLQLKESASSSDEPQVHGKDSASGQFPGASSLKYRFSSSVKSASKVSESIRRNRRARRSKKSISKPKKIPDTEEVVITDELIAEIASKKGARVTAGELTEMMKSSPKKKKAETIPEPDEEVTTVVSVPSVGSETVHHRGDRQGKAVATKTAGFVPSYIRSRFCMDFLDFFKHIVNDADDDTLDEYTVHSNTQTWKESVGEETTGTATYDTDGGLDELQERSRVTFSFSDAENMTSDDTDAYTSAEDSKDQMKDWTTWK